MTPVTCITSQVSRLDDLAKLTIVTVHTNNISKHWTTNLGHLSLV